MFICIGVGTSTPWIQVNLGAVKEVKQLSTQGGYYIYAADKLGEYYVTEFNVKYGDSETDLKYVKSGGDPKVLFKI